MNGNMIRQIRQQQMKRKEGACQEEVIHRVQIVPAQRRQNEHQKEKEEQRHGREVADPPCQRSRLQLLRHLQCYVEPGHQILVIPLQLPAARRLPLSVGESELSGKSKPEKSVLTSRWKSRACEISLPLCSAFSPDAERSVFARENV